MLNAQQFAVFSRNRSTIVVFGVHIAAVMEKAPEAFKGIAAPHFPNYFFAVGPNGLPLDAPYFKTAERNVETIVTLLREKQAANAKAMAVKPELNREYNDMLLERFPKYSWGSPACSSYYQDESGRAPFLFPGRFKEYVDLHAKSGLHEYDLS